MNAGRNTQTRWISPLQAGGKITRFSQNQAMIWNSLHATRVNLPNHNQPQVLALVPQAGPGAWRPGQHRAVAPRAGPTRGEGCCTPPRSRGLGSAPSQPCAPRPSSVAPASVGRPGPANPQRRSGRRWRGPWVRRIAGLQARLPGPDPQVWRRPDVTPRSPDPPIPPTSRLDWTWQNRGQHSPPLPSLSPARTSGKAGHCFCRSQISLPRDQSFGGLSGLTLQSSLNSGFPKLWSFQPRFSKTPFRSLRERQRTVQDFTSLLPAINEMQGFR